MIGRVSGVVDENEMSARVGPGRVDRRALAPLAVLAFAQDAIYALIFLSFMNHYLLVVVRTSPGVPAYTLALFGGTRLIVHPLAGKLIDATNPRLVLRISVIAQLAAVALLLLVHGIGAFLAATVLLAAGSASIWPLIYETLARTQPADVRSRATGVLAIVGYVGTMVGFLSGVLLGRLVGSHVPFWLTGGFVATAGLAQGARAFSGARGPQLAEERAPTSSGASRAPGLAFFALLMFLDFAAIAALAGVYGPFSRISLGINLLKTTLLLLPAGAAAALSLWIVSRHSKPGRRVRELSALYLIAGAGVIALAASPGPWTALFMAIPLGAGLGGIGPIIAATVVDLGASENGGTVVGSLLAVEGVGSVVGPLMVGFITDTLSPRAGMGAIGVIFVTLVAVTLVGNRAGVSADQAVAHVDT